MSSVFFYVKVVEDAESLPKQLIRTEIVPIVVDTAGVEECSWFVDETKRV